MAWMVVEAGVAITAGIAASSIALVGFGLDSVIELFSAGIVVWQLRGEGEERETPAVRLIGLTFFALAAYLAAESIHDLVSHARPQQSVAGLAVTAAALVAQYMQTLMEFPPRQRPDSFTVGDVMEKLEAHRKTLEVGSGGGVK